MIFGQRIMKIRTLKSAYDNDCVEVTLDTGEILRMKTDVISQMVNEFVFKIEKKRKYSYITEAIPFDENYEENKREMLKNDEKMRKKVKNDKKEVKNE